MIEEPELMATNSTTKRRSGPKVPISARKNNPGAVPRRNGRVGNAQSVDAVRRERDLLSGIIENSSDLVAAVNHHFEYIAFNQAYHRQCQEVFGVEIRLGARLSEVLAGFPEDKQNALALFGRALQGEAVSVTQEFGGAGEARRWYELRFSPIRETGGRVTGAAQIGREITQRMRAEELLRKNEEQFRAMFSVASFGKAQADPATGRLLRVNDALCRMTGYTEDELLKRSVREITHPEDRETDWASFSRMASGEAQGYENEKRYVRADGTIIWVHISANLIRDVAGRPLRTTAVIQDITERKRVEEGLRRSEERFKLAMQGAGVGLWDWDIRTGKVYYSPRWKALFGYAEDEIGDRLEDWIQLLHPDEKEWILKFLEDFLAGTAQNVTAEYRLRHKDGTYRWIDASAIVVRDENGKACRLVGSHGDITARKQVELALQHTRDRSDLLSRTTSALLRAPDPQKLVEGLCNQVRTFLNCDVFFNFLLDQEKRRLQLNACGGVAPKLARKVEGLELGASLCGTAARDACRVHAEHLGTSDDPRSALVRSLGIRAYACHPLLGPQNEVIGTLSFGARDRDSFGPEDLELMKTVTDHVAIAMLRRRSEEALRASEEFNRSVVQNTTAIILRMDATARITFANERALKFFGYSPEELIGKPALGTIVPQRDITGRDLATMVRDIAAFPDSFHSNTNENMRKNGERVWLEWTNSGIYDAQGGLKEFLSVGIDITERKRAEEAARLAERLYRAVGESIDYGIWVCDAHGRNTYASESFLKMVGMTQEQCSEFGWGNVLHPDEAADTIAAWKECVKTGGPWYREHRYRGVDGRWHPVLACGVAVRGQSGEITHWSGINLDISRLKEAQEQLQKAKEELAQNNARLERVVQERTAELRDLVGELEHFSYSITHDMRAPLRAMTGFTEVLKELVSSGAQEEQMHFLSRIADAARRMDLLITDALSYSRAVRNELPLEPVDVGRLVRSMLDTYPEFQVANADIRIGGELPTVMGNEAGLTQCFSNLLVNAVKFAQPGKRALVLVRGEMRDGWVRLWVEDHGIGISPTLIPRVFNMFSKGSSDQAGTGIGLALVRKVVQRMGGRVGVESEQGKGSRFWVELRPGDLGTASPVLS